MKTHRPKYKKAIPKKSEVFEPSLHFDDKANHLEFLKAFISLVFSIIILLIFENLIYLFYHPDIGQAIALAKQYAVAYSPEVYKPEPKEMTMFVMGVLLFSLSLAGIYYVVNLYIKDMDEHRLRKLSYFLWFMTMMIVLILGYLAYAAPNPMKDSAQSIMDYKAKTNFDFYFIDTFVYDHFFIYLLLGFPLVLLYFYYEQRNLDKPGEKLVNITKYLSHGVFCILLFIIFFTVTFRFPYTYENKYDFNAVYYAVVQVYYGLPMLVDHFTSTYGLYPHFLVPLLKISGLSILSFTVLMGLMTCCCFIFYYLFLQRMVKNQVIILLTFTSYYFFFFEYGKIILNFDPYFAMVPLRLILPLSLLFYAMMYLKYRKRWMQLVAYFVFSLGILWTPDFGMISLFALFLFHVYLECYRRPIFGLLKKVLLHAGAAIVAVTLMLTAFALYIKLFYGSFPAFGSLFSTLNFFSLIGANMIPMPSGIHPWMLVVLIFMTGLILSLKHLITRIITERSALIFLVTVLGTGLFSYYIGRSHNGNLGTSFTWAFLLLGIFADDLLKLIKENRIYVLPFVVIVFILSLSCFNIIYDINKITGLMSEKENQVQNKEEQQIIMQMAEFVKSNVAEKEKIMIFTKPYLQAILHGYSHTLAAVNPGIMDMFYKSDYQRICRHLEESKNTKVFFDPFNFIFYDLDIPLIITSLYNVQEVEEPAGPFFLMKKKPFNQMPSFVFDKDTTDVFHELIDRDIARRMLYTMGKIGPITLGKTFSAQVVFRPEKIPSSKYSVKSTLFCNADSLNGMALSQQDSLGKKFIFTVPQMGLVINGIIPGKWNYIALEMKNNQISAFVNGNILGPITLPTEYHESEKPLYIGNYNKVAGLFLGDIRELRISHHAMDQNESIKVWNRIQSDPEFKN